MGAKRIWRTPLAHSLLTAVLAYSIIAIVFLGGQRRGMDHKVEVYPNDQLAIAIALSDVVYHLDAGYLGYATVLSKLQEIWNQASSTDLAVTAKNFSDRELINQAIREASSLGTQAPGFVSDRSLITMIYSDLGYVDFTEWSFRIFGLKIEALYYTFFLILSLSTFVYLIVFWSDPVPKTVLLLTLFSFLVELHTGVFGPNMPSFTGLRHASALALIPAWHFAFLLIYRRPASVGAAVATLIQLAVLLLAIKMRSTAAWVFVFLAILSVVLAASGWRRLPAERRTWTLLVRSAITWPITLVFAGAFLHSVYANSRLHPVYFTDDVLNYHEFWEGAYIGILSMAPELIPPDSAALETFRSTHNLDQAGYTAAAEYLIQSRFMRSPPDFPRSYPPGFISPWTGAPKFRLNNEIMRHVVYRLATRRPLGMLKLYVLTKPYYITASVVTALGPGQLGWPWLLVAGAFVGFIVIGIASPGLADLPNGHAVALVAASVPFAALPNLWTFAAHHVIADLFLVTLTLLQVLICWALIITVKRFGAPRSPGVINNFRDHELG
jgi:hypothetical protein